MTDKKLTDNEIIKALECCKDADCLHCPCWSGEWHGGMCNEFLSTVLDFINRQKAEIEGLAAERDAMHRDVIAAEEYSWQLITEKDNLIRSYAACQAEAIKEFAERLNKEAEKVCIDREGDFVESDGEIYYTVADWCKKTSDNILKEMVGKDNA